MLPAGQAKENRHLMGTTSGNNSAGMQTESTLPFPPVTPIGERLAEPNDDFTDRCMRALDDYPVTKEWTLVAQQLTHSDDWGLIWRGTFHRTRKPGDLSSNPIVVCWTSDNGDLNVMFGLREDREGAS